MSADQDDVYGLTNLGRCYEFAIGVAEIDLEESKNLYERVVKLNGNDADSKVLLNRVINKINKINATKKQKI